jgi:uncharacterized protein (DUF1501 family)
MRRIAMNHSRRDLLKTVAAAPALLSMASNAAPPEDRDTVLVLVELSGGNDGLNTVVPYADDAYGRKRTTLRLTNKEVHRIDDYCGFHPRMKGLARLYKEGRLGVIRGVGYPKNDRSHEKAKLEWYTARPGRPDWPTGWIGRAADSVCEQDKSLAPAVFVGSIARPLAVNAARAVVPAIRTAKDLTLKTALNTNDHKNKNPLAEHVRRATKAARETSRRIEAVLSDSPGRKKGLEGDLQTVSRLIRADVGIRIFLLELGGGGIGGFDNHAWQRDNHASLLAKLSEAAASFADDLARHKCLDRVALMTFSEFGRTLTENGRRGTGHGAAQPVLLMGGKVRGGLIGKYPSLTDLDQDAPKFHTDYRRVFATMLDKWLGFDSKVVLGEKYETLDLFA